MCIYIGGKLCWHTIYGAGGYRSGATMGLNSDTTWMKYIYTCPGPLKYMISTCSGATCTFAPTAGYYVQVLNIIYFKSSETL